MTVYSAYPWDPEDRDSSGNEGNHGHKEEVKAKQVVDDEHKHMAWRGAAQERHRKVLLHPAGLRDPLG